VQARFLDLVTQAMIACTSYWFATYVSLGSHRITLPCRNKQEIHWVATKLDEETETSQGPWDCDL
jgi:hypothetical protein